MTHDTWLATHSYLQPLASLQEQVNSTLDEILTVSDCIPVWDNYPMIFMPVCLYCRAPKAASIFEPAERIIALLLERLASTSLPDPLAEESNTLDARNASRERCTSPCVSLADLRCRIPMFLPRLAALPWLDSVVSVSASVGDSIWQLAGRRSLAPRLLSYLWIIAGHGATGRNRSRASPASGLWPLRYALGIPENGLPVLRNTGPSPARGAGSRRRSRSSH